MVLNRGHGVVAALAAAAAQLRDMLCRCSGLKPAAAAAQLRDMLCRCSGLKPGWLEYAVTAVTAVTL